MALKTAMSPHNPHDDVTWGTLVHKWQKQSRRFDLATGLCHTFYFICCL